MTDNTETYSSGSDVITISHTDRINEGGIIRSINHTVKHFDNKEEANKYWMKHLNKHYIMEEQTVKIHIITHINHDLKGY